jgi:hypothetical protein
MGEVRPHSLLAPENRCNSVLAQSWPFEATPAALAYFRRSKWSSHLSSSCCRWTHSRLIQVRERYEVPSRPRMRPDDVAPVLSLNACGMQCALAFEVRDHL